MTGTRVKPRVAIRPFAKVTIPAKDKRTGDDVWLYVGEYDGQGEPPHLKVRDFENAQKAVK